MRPNGFCVLATLALAAPAMMTDAAAQARRGGGPAAAPAAAPRISAPAAAPRMSAPAPRFSAPAAHFAAPRVATPHVAAPRMATPHVSSPRMATPHVATPRINTQRFNTQRLANPHVGRSHVASPRIHTAPGVTRRNAGVAGPAAERLNRHAGAPSTNRAGATAGNAADRLRGRNAPNTVGQGPARNAAAALHATRQGNRGQHILRNAALANPSRRDPAARSLSDSTFRGRFAQSSFARDFGRDRRHHHHRHFGFVLGFAGPVFWPYAYSDFVDYTFWPSAYDTFWPYAYDDVYEGLYGGYAPQYGAAYAYAGAPASGRAYTRGGAAGQASAATQICSGDSRGLTDFPIEQIARQVQPTPDQQKLLDDLKAANGKAVATLQSACPNDLPATPTGRLAAMRVRVQAMLQAVQTVRPALEAFYASLSDEQKERFNALDQGTAGAAAPDEAGFAQFCGGQKASVVNLPTGRIEQSLRLNQSQEAALNEVNDASAKASETLNAACPNGEGQEMLTPPGRVRAMQQRLDAMLQAIETVRPALTKFYGSLSDEQKARFDRLGRKTT
jgi:hypothetical protein